MFIALSALIAVRTAGASVSASVGAFFAVFSLFFPSLFKMWWCSTLAQPGSNKPETESTADEEKADSEADQVQEQRR